MGARFMVSHRWKEVEALSVENDEQRTKMNDDEEVHDSMMVRQSLMPFRQQCFALHHKVALLRSAPIDVIAQATLVGWLMVSLYCCCWLVVVLHYYTGKVMQECWIGMGGEETR